MSKNKDKSKPFPVAAFAAVEPHKKRTLAHDAHWADWQKRHRAPRATDLLRKIRSEETVKRQAEKTLNESLGDVQASFDVENFEKT